MKNSWKSKTKRDLAIEVWEALDCESIGRTEIEQIERVIGEQFGFGAVESPMRIARLLADEGAELRHSEILELAVARATIDKYAAAFRNLIKFSDFNQAENTFKNVDNLRANFLRENDRAGLRALKQKVSQARERALMIARNENVNPTKRAEKAEIAEWFKIWLETPELFASWLILRKKSTDFQERFLKSQNLSE